MDWDDIRRKRRLYAVVASLGRGGGTAASSTWNPADKAAGITLTNGNLTATGDAVAGYDNVRGTSSKTTGKWAFEVTKVGAPGMGVGVGLSTASLTNYLGNDRLLGFGYYHDGFIQDDSSIDAFSAGDVILLAVDADARLVKLYKNGVQVGTAGGYALPAAGALFPMFGAGTGVAGSGTLNVNPASPPSGYAAWG